MRAEDAVGRMGGEEFLVLLPDTGRSAAARAAERLRAAVAAADGPEPLTASVGWATLEPDEDPDDTHPAGRRRPSTRPRAAAATASWKPSGDLLACPVAHDADRRGED